LRYGTLVSVTADDSGLLVKSDIARLQIDQETKPTEPQVVSGQPPVASDAVIGSNEVQSEKVEKQKPKRYHGTVQLDSARVGRDAGRIADEVISHLVGLVGSNVTVTLEIEAEIPEGTPDHVVRTVTENGRTLKFQPNSGFESD
jgi:hypothetical protein